MYLVDATEILCLTKEVTLALPAWSRGYLPFEVGARRGERMWTRLRDALSKYNLQHATLGNTFIPVGEVRCPKQRCTSGRCVARAPPAQSKHPEPRHCGALARRRNLKAPARRPPPRTSRRSGERRRDAEGAQTPGFNRSRSDAKAKALGAGVVSRGCALTSSPAAAPTTPRCGGARHPPPPPPKPPRRARALRRRPG